MSCEDMEEMLARYASGDLTGDEAFVVRMHLSLCEECRASFEIYRSLESALDARSGERPPARGATRKIVARIKREEPHAFVSSLRTAPLIIGAVVVLSILLTAAFALIGGSRHVPQRMPGPVAWERYIAGMPDWIAGALGGEAWLIFLVYSGLAAGFILSGSLLMLRFTRQSR